MSWYETGHKLREMAFPWIGKEFNQIRITHDTKQTMGR